AATCFVASRTHGVHVRESLRKLAAWNASSMSEDSASPPSPPFTPETETPDSVAGTVSLSRRELLGGSLAGAAVLGTLAAPALAQAQVPVAKGTISHYHVRATDKSVHWGYFSKKLTPVVTVNSSDFVTMEAITHHAYDDFERMIKGDPGVESIFYWDKKR